MDVAEKNEKKLRRQMRTTSKILLGFLLAILTGAVLLTLPVATVSGEIRFPDGVIYCDNLRLRDGACSCSDLFVLDIIW